MFEQLGLGILQGGLAAVQTYSDTIGTTAVALSFLMSLVRVVYMAYERGIEQWTVYARKQTALFFIVVALCFPIGLLGDGGSFITGFPAMVIKTGLKGIDSKMGALSATSYSDSLAKKVRDAASGGDQTSFEDHVKTLVKNAAEAMNGVNRAIIEKSPSSVTGIDALANVLKVTGIAMLVFIPIGCMTLPVFILNVWVGAGALLLELIVCWVMAAAMVMPEIAGPEIIGSSLGVSMATLVYDFVKACTRELGIAMFYTALTFGFFGTMVSVALKSAVFCATFPISVVNLAFEKQVSVFIQNVVKIFSLAITPFILVTTFQILIAAFGQIAKPGGAFDMVMMSYVVANFNPAAAEAGTVSGAIELYALLFRLLISCFLSPTLMAVPAVAIMLQSHKIAGELLGSAVGYSTGLSQGFSRAGGNIGARGMGM